MITVSGMLCADVSCGVIHGLRECSKCKLFYCEEHLQQGHIYTVVEPPIEGSTGATESQYTKACNFKEREEETVPWLR